MPSSQFSGADYARNLREVSADVREWGDAPKHVRERCVAAEREVEHLRAQLRYLAYGLVIDAGGDVRVIPSAIGPAGLREVRKVFNA